MKKSLLIISLFASLVAMGQKRLSATANVSYDEFGMINYIDSSAYTYNTGGYGDFNSLKPVFQFDGGIFSYYLNLPMILCNAENSYGGSSYPLSLSSTTNNTLTNNLISEANNSNSFRTLYTYNTAGQVLTEVNQNFNSPNWETNDSISNTYDALGNKLTHSYYQLQPSLTLMATDSMQYMAGSTKLISSKSYYLNTTLDLENQTLITYTGNNIQNLDLYQGNGSGGVDWAFRINYTYNGSTPTAIVGYPIIGSNPSPIPVAQGAYVFNAQNQHTGNYLVLAGDTLEKVTYTYDADGFVKSENFYSQDSNGDMYLSDVSRFYYISTAGIEEKEAVSISIYPNPTKDILTVESSSKIENIQILNLNGQVLLSQGSNKVDINHLPAGTYFVNGNTATGSFSKKIVKE
jgi:hypothetical protein